MIVNYQIELESGILSWTVPVLAQSMQELVVDLAQARRDGEERG